MSATLPNIAVVAGGPTRKGLLSKLPNLRQFLGPIKAESYRTASRKARGALGRIECR